MNENDDIALALQEMLAEMILEFDARVPAEGAFADLRKKRQVHFGDPATSQPGLLELAVMCMDEALNPAHRTLRFVAVRVKKSARGGTSSSTCFHGSRAEVLAHLMAEKQNPTLLLERTIELAAGLPEETDSRLWR